MGTKIIIIGAGFGGLNAAKALAKADVEVLLIDRHNYHTFSPLLYQVATCGLEPEEIAYPVRGIFRRQSNLSFLMGEVMAIDTGAKVVQVLFNGNERQESYDYLIVAGGSTTNFFNTPGLDQYAFELKTLDDAVLLRNHILTMFENATWTEDDKRREALKTLVVVGGGPTGLETAGALFELYKHVLSKEYPYLRDEQPRVILVEATDRLLAPYPESLQQAALDQLKSLGVDVILDNPVQEVTADEVRLKDGRVIASSTLIWSAGVQASPLANMLGVELQRGGRVPVLPTLQVIGLDAVYVVGDMAYLPDKNGQPYPQMIPAAQQQGALASKNILCRLRGEQEVPFSFVDRGIMATIGRSRAVAYIYNRIPLRGYIAWMAWLILHLVSLMGFRNRLNVLINWIWNYLTYDRSIRVIFKHGASATNQQDTVSER
jgi:NADH dehydrogenase